MLFKTPLKCYISFTIASASVFFVRTRYHTSKRDKFGENGWPVTLMLQNLVAFTIALADACYGLTEVLLEFVREFDLELNFEWNQI